VKVSKRSVGVDGFDQRGAYLASAEIATMLLWDQDGISPSSRQQRATGGVHVRERSHRKLRMDPQVWPMRGPGWSRWGTSNGSGLPQPADFTVMSPVMVAIASASA
jgi:hypothetical protein